MYDTAENGIDHSKNRLDAVNMKADKKNKTVSRDDLFLKLFQDLKLPNLEEVSYKEEKIGILGFEKYRKIISYKYYNLNGETLQKNKKEKTIFEIFFGAMVEHFIKIFNHFIIKN